MERDTMELDSGISPLERGTPRGPGVVHRSRPEPRQPPGHVQGLWACECALLLSDTIISLPTHTRVLAQKPTLFNRPPAPSSLRLPLSLPPRFGPPHLAPPLSPHSRLFKRRPLLPIAPSPSDTTSSTAHTRLNHRVASPNNTFKPQPCNPKTTA